MAKVLFLWKVCGLSPINNSELEYSSLNLVFDAFGAAQYGLNIKHIGTEPNLR